MHSFGTPRDVAEEMVALGVKKSRLSTGEMLVQGAFAGAYIAFAAALATTVSTGWNLDGVNVFFGMKKFMLGSVFSVGLMLVVILGAELFTGNCLMPGALAAGKISGKSMAKSWILVWLGNLAGALLLALLIGSFSGLLSGPVGDTAIRIASSKAGLSVWEIFIRGILANWVVCLAILMALAAKDVAGKILAIFFPIMGFAASGFEHSVANMYFIPVALLVKGSATAAHPDLNVLNAVTNILVSTAGNIVGGSLLVALPYYYVHRKSLKDQ